MSFGARTFSARVMQREHANQDSLPFRYGFNFSQNQDVLLFDCKNYVWEQNTPDFKKYKCFANFEDPKKNLLKGYFVILEIAQDYPIVATVIRKDIDTEFYLSNLLKNLRKEKKISVSELLEMHPLYEKNQLNSSAQLFEYLIGKRSKTKINELQEVFDKSEKQSKRELNDLLKKIEVISNRSAEQESKYYAIRDIAEQSVEAVKDLEENNKKLEVRNKTISDERSNLQVRLELTEKELKAYKEEEISAKHSKDGPKLAQLTNRMLLERVQPDVSYKGAVCTELNFADGTKKYVKLKTFDPTRRVTSKAKSLEGKYVKTTTWNPINDPLKWTKSGYFNNIYEVGDEQDLTNYESVETKKSFLQDETEGSLRPRLPLGKGFSTHKSFKIYGPPGTGKTTFLVNKVVEEVEKGTLPENIGFISFSNEAANVAKQRISQRFDYLGVVDFPNFVTMHALATVVGGKSGNQLMKEEDFQRFDKKVVCWSEWTSLGDPQSVVTRLQHPVLDFFSLCTSRQVPFLGESFVTEFRQWWPSKQHDCCDFLSSYFCVSPEDIKIKLAFYVEKYVQSFEDFKKENSLISFDDVITKVSSDSFPEDRIPTFDLLIIDEAQDLSSHLWEFAKKLINMARLVLIAGDDDQAINVGIGADPKMFVKYHVTEQSLNLTQSYRIPKSIQRYVNHGVMKVIDRLPDREKKDWLPVEREGRAVPGYQILDQNNVFISERLIGQNEIANKILLDWKKFTFENDRLESLENKPPVLDWLIMAPTRRTGQVFSDILKDLNVKHFYRNKPVLNATVKETNIRVQTVHISKGAEARNVVILISGFGDLAIFSKNPRLAYVALTRASETMYPRVVQENYLPKMRGTSNVFNAYNRMFPLGKRTAKT